MQPLDLFFVPASETRKLGSCRSSLHPLRLSPLWADTARQPAGLSVSEPSAKACQIVPKSCLMSSPSAINCIKEINAVRFVTGGGNRFLHREATPSQRASSHPAPFLARREQTLAPPQGSVKAKLQSAHPPEILTQKVFGSKCRKLWGRGLVWFGSVWLVVGVCF